MVIKNKVRPQVSQELDILIPENKWAQYIDLLDREGKFTRKSLMAIVFILCQQVENLENVVEEMAFQVEILNGSQPKGATKPTVASFHIKTPVDIAREMDKQFSPELKAFYLDARDWAIYEKVVDPSLTNDDPKHGYGKEVDPRDGKLKTCLIYHDLPVFKN